MTRRVPIWLATLVLLELSVPACGGPKTSPAVTARPDSLEIPSSPWRQTPDGCPVFALAAETGRVADPDLSELSGLAVGRRNPDVLWVHNDSGDTAGIYALSPDGRLLGHVEIPDVSPRDVEDLAITPAGPEAVPLVLMGDIGDNRSSREAVRVYRFPEPEDVVTGTNAAVNVETLEAVYPDGPHNAEALLADPITADIYVLTKEPPGTSGIFRWRDPSPESTATLEHVADLSLSGVSADGLVTAADVTDDGTGVLVRTYTSLLWWNRDPEQPLESVFSAEPCSLPLKFESQGEAVGLTPAGDAYWTTSEGENEPLYRYAREA